MQQQLRIVIADDHASIRQNLRYILEAELDMKVVGSVGTAHAAVEATRELGPDVLVIDHDLPDRDGLTVGRALCAAGVPTRVVLYTMDTEICPSALHDGLRAVSKDAPTSWLLSAIRGGDERPRSDRPCVLVVDDEADIRSVIREALEVDGAEVIESADGFDALIQCERHIPTVVVLDLGLPNMSGREFATAYRRLRTAPAPIVVVSARANASATAAEFGAFAVLTKPFALEELSAVVQRASAAQPHA